MQGKITRFFPDRHFGFIRELETGNEWFFHEDDTALSAIERGVLVTFQAGKYNGKPKAVNIRKLTPAEILGGAQ